MCHHAGWGPAQQSSLSEFLLSFRPVRSSLNSVNRQPPWASGVRRRVALPTHGSDKLKTD